MLTCVASFEADAILRYYSAYYSHDAARVSKHRTARTETDLNHLKEVGNPFLMAALFSPTLYALFGAGQGYQDVETIPSMAILGCRYGTVVTTFAQSS